VRGSFIQRKLADAASRARAALLAWTAWPVVSLWSRSIRTRFENREVRERLSAEGKSCIYAFFHGDLFALLLSHRDVRFLVPISESRDGEIIARVLSRFGFEVVRGSSKRHGHKALLALVRGMREGKTVAIAVDGPRGPLHEVKTGAVFLAGTSHAPIIPVAAAATHAAVMDRSWDKLMVPAPFTECLVRYGDPIHVNGTSSDAIESGQRRLEAALQRLTHEAAQGHNAGRRSGADRQPELLTQGKR